jgi:hypothetical protein
MCFNNQYRCLQMFMFICKRSILLLLLPLLPVFGTLFGSWTYLQVFSRMSCTMHFSIIPSGVRLSPLGTAATTGLLYRPQMMDDGDYGAIGRMKTSRGNRNTRRKPAPVPLCPPQIPHDLTRARTRAAAVGSQRLTACELSHDFAPSINSSLSLKSCDPNQFFR